MFEPLVEDQFYVPCDGCVECCTKHQLVEILPGDDPSRYDLIEIKGRKVLRHQPNGDCMYLVRNGNGGHCSIWNDRPILCREFDCRDMVKWLHGGKVTHMSPGIRVAGERLIQLEVPPLTRRPRYIGSINPGEQRLSLGF